VIVADTSAPVSPATAGVLKNLARRYSSSNSETTISEIWVSTISSYNQSPHSADTQTAYDESILPRSPPVVENSLETGVFVGVLPYAKHRQRFVGMNNYRVHNVTLS